MSALVVRWLINALALYLTAVLLPGVTLRGAGPTLLGAAVLGIVNTLIRPVLALLTLPLTVVTLGLFTFVVNAVMLLPTSAVGPAFGSMASGRRWPARWC